MRVIAGTARSIPLKAPEGMDTRPTTDRIKETLFNILQFDLQGAVFIDLFAGSGSIGIEALSRGAKSAVFVDNRKASIDVIEANVRKCGFYDRARIVRTDAENVNVYFPKDLSEDDRLIIFMDPPYNMGLELKALKQLMLSGRLGMDTLIIVEESLEAELKGLDELGLEITRVKEYKNQKHLFIKIRG